MTGTLTSEAPRRRPGGDEPDPAARCPAPPASPPTSGRGSGERGRRRRTSSGQEGGSLREEEDALREQRHGQTGGVKTERQKHESEDAGTELRQTRQRPDRLT